MDKNLIDRIDLRLKKLGKTDRGASMEATGKPDLVRQLRKQRVANPRIDTMKKLADTLQTSSEWLIEGTGPEEIDQTRTTDESFPAAQLSEDRNQPIIANQSSQSIPVMGTAAGSIIGADVLSSEPVEYVPSPPGLVGVREAYMLWVSGDSMAPKFESGEPLFINPHRPVRQGDYVVVQVHDNGDGIKALVKRFISANDTAIVVEQFNPPKQITINTEEIYRVHRVLTAAEIAGI